jgi:glycosyltransferase involved in cell wall biosynthesis
MKFVIITPAFNEEKNIALTIESVLTQLIKPLLWIIVDDGSTDNTADIIKNYTNNHKWIKYVYREKKPEQTYFASNVYAIKKGTEYISNIDYDYLAILDADITLPPDYYQNIANVLTTNKNLGIVSGNCADKIGDQIIKHLYDRRSCAKAVIVFRRECYEQIGGFIPMKYGGEDTCACFTARMKGWKTWAFHDF